MASPVNLNIAPWTMKKGLFEKFVAVTEQNRKNAIVLGRILYIIEKNGNIITYRGHIVIDPCYSKGDWKVPYTPFTVLPKDITGKTHWDLKVTVAMKNEEYVNKFKTLIDKFISENSLYINPSDPILEFFKL